MLYYQQGVLEEHWIWTYDALGRMTSSQTVVSDPAKDQHVYGRCGDCGLSSGTTIYRYDEKNRITEEQTFEPGDKLVDLNRYSYDEQGNRTRQWSYQFDPTQEGQQKKPLIPLTVNGIEYSATWTNGLPTTTFTYDDWGNWIKEVSVRQTGPSGARDQTTSVRYRLIEYY
jgi:hypothetical protein